MKQVHIYRAATCKSTTKLRAAASASNRSSEEDCPMAPASNDDSDAPRRATLADVARRAHVAVSTASMALNGQPMVAAETREAVITAARELGYRPNSTARSLRRGGTALAGLIVGPELGAGGATRPVFFFHRAMAQLTDELARRGWATVQVSRPHHSRDSDFPADVIAILNDDPSQGPIDWLPPGVPVVVVDPARGDSPLTTYVGHDVAAATRTVFDHLQENRSLRPALLVDRAPSTTADVMSDAYRTWCESAACEPLIFYTENRSLSADLADAMKRAGVDGLLSYTGWSNKVLATLLERGFRVPQDLRLVVLGEGLIERDLEPPVSYLSFEAAQTGTIIADTIVRAASGEPPTTVVLPHSFVALESSTGIKVRPLEPSTDSD